MSKDFQSLNKSLSDKIKQLQLQFTIDDTLLEICNDSLNDQQQQQSKGIKPRQLSKILKKTNLTLENGYHRYYSKESIAQITEQIINKRNDDALNNEEFLDFLQDIDLPIFLQSDYKVHSLKTVIDQISQLPEIDTDTDIENEQQYIRYNKKRNELIEKINTLNSINSEIKSLNNYNQLIQLKLTGEHDSITPNIRQNTLNKNNKELNNEITKFKINMEKYKLMRAQDKLKFKSILRNE